MPDRRDVRSPTDPEGPMLRQGLDAGVARTLVRGLDAWNGVVNGTFENITVDAAHDAFESVMEVRRFGGLDLPADRLQRSRRSPSPPIRRGEHARYFKLHIAPLIGTVGQGAGCTAAS